MNLSWLLVAVLAAVGVVGEEACRDGEDSLQPLGTITYFPQARGRAEPIRLILAANLIAWEENHELDKEMAGSVALPFGQWPLWTQPSWNRPLAQTDAITRHLGRLVGWYGLEDVDSRIDELLGGVEGLRAKHTQYMYGGSEATLEQYKELHVSRAGVNQRNGGAHLQYLENLLLEEDDGEWWSTGRQVTIADAQLFDIVDLHVTLLGGENIAASFPKLAKLHAKFASLPGIAAYLKSSMRNPPKLKP
ncbi:hypothetical protein BASA81_008872 [Batrachochytrium salamandrivorans]|nr:hypothetical protein BASA81_008872 [Batrachochytrium salamandrivorans]